MAILQKVSIKEDTIPIFLKKAGHEDMIDWVLGLIERSTKKPDIHIFSLDFSSALLANILHAPATQDHLAKSPQQVKSLILKLLKLLREKIPTSVLMHLMICLSYLKKDRFA